LARVTELCIALQELQELGCATHGQLEMQRLTRIARVDLQRPQDPRTLRAVRVVDQNDIHLGQREGPPQRAFVPRSPDALVVVVVFEPDTYTTLRVEVQGVGSLAVARIGGAYDQGDNATGPVPSQMLKAVMTTISRTKITT
jgi:hypothetical protein